jgi:hypothetical protein
VLAARDQAHVLFLHVLRRFEVMWPEVVGPARAQLMQKVQARVGCIGKKGATYAASFRGVTNVWDVSRSWTAADR